MKRKREERSEAGQRSAVVEAVGIAVQLVLGQEGK